MGRNRFVASIGRYGGMLALETNRISRLAILAAVLTVPGACANPWKMPPRGSFEAGLQRMVISSVSTRYGNYCGYGRRYASFSVPPVDPLDAACRSHDLCYGAGRARCDCDAELAGKANALAKDKRLAREMRKRASIIAQSVSLPICKIFPDGFLPAFDRPA